MEKSLWGATAAWAPLTLGEARETAGGGGPRPPANPPIDWIDPPVPPVLLPAPVLLQ